MLLLLRRLLLELAALLPTSAVIGFLGPFGSFLSEPFLARVAHWLALLLGAWIVVRPTLFVLDHLARATQLPRHAVRWFGVVAVSGPLAVVWRTWGVRETQRLGLTGVLLFALLCAVLTTVIAWWAERADAHLRARSSAQQAAPQVPVAASSSGAHGAETAIRSEGAARLQRRLSRSFCGPITALESEDHYVRVHGTTGSELILLRLRDAIAEMDDHQGVQTHRSWWVAKDAIASFAADTRHIILTNGVRAPVARDTVARLKRQNLLL